ncbi:SDR family oxidoreductase [Niabella drilacis]|uniref:dTDP-4-dehydrorhamnose reductase n=1 Tax=Niabella drilacis (strain DSM 25811 / CCM 8410 / CCUG 62505 / LMG 26954 / E90) TaxID=1285928 RepID=A0A1G6IFF9_NIADE|nr:SDR family oxidoreductase [Niabella drilacis]SDC05282.1 dTDP-4-dehydrorhamnose reductase [Niabella drilacis]
MKILVTGSNGLVGSYVVQQLLDAGHTVFASSRMPDLSAFDGRPGYRFVQMDFTDPYALDAAFEAIQPEVVVHGGAMSKPDDCEKDQAEAYKINTVGTVQLLLNAAAHRSFFVFLSTDFIFNGQGGMHTENDPAGPLSYYGRTKLEAEEAVREYEYPWAIVRTVFVYGKPLYGRDCFVTMISKKIRNREAYRVVNDQERTPTYAGDLAKGIAAIIEKKATGIFHLCGEDQLSPYGMATRVAAYLGLDAPLLEPVTTASLNALARRPLKSGLDISRAKQVLGYAPVSFREGLEKTLGG